MTPMSSLVGSLSVAHVADDMSVLAGGVPAAVRQLLRHSAGAGIRVSLTHAGGDTTDLHALGPVAGFPPAGPLRIWHHGPGLNGSLQATVRRAAAEGGVVHLHGVWAATQYLAARLCTQHRVPFVFTPHGMVQPWMWQHHRGLAAWKNSAYWRLLARPALAGAAALHAITPDERDQLHRLFPGHRVVTIPNAVDLPVQPPPSAGPRERNIVFMGRLHPVKGVHLLVEAFARSRLASPWTLTVAGPDWQADYRAGLDAQVRQAGLGDRVRFVGPVFGADKARLLATAWVAAVPSFTEVIGMVNLETAAIGLPSITTVHTGLADWCEGGGLLVTPDVPALVAALRQAAGWTDDERARRAQASWELVRRRYSWAVTLPQWQSLYGSLRPDTVAAPALSGAVDGRPSTGGLTS